jgi:hypothetical protein
MGSATRYGQDFFAWANEQAGLLRAGRLAEADIAHIADEIESMGKSEKRELVSRLTVLLLRLLKWQFQAALRSHSWRNSVRVQRISLDSLIRDNPSLMSVRTNARGRSLPDCPHRGRRRDRHSGGNLPAGLPVVVRVDHG